MGMTFDLKDFEKGFKKIAREAPEVLGEGMFNAGNAMLRDGIYERPYAPFDEGHLRGSARTVKVQEAKGEVEVHAGFNINYAARWHELSPAEDKRINWSLPGSGRKYLETKMIRNKVRYLKIIAETVRRVFAKGKP